MKLIPIFIIILVLLNRDIIAQENDRTAFYDDLYAKTLLREAWSPVKWQKLGTDFETECAQLNLRKEFAQADTYLKLLRAIHKFNYARKDRHLRLYATRNYMDYDDILQAPIRFYPDLSDEENYFFFVANLTQEVLDKGISKGDKLLKINGIPTNEYIDYLSSYLRYSTFRHMLVTEAPKYIGAKSDIFGPELGLSDKVTFIMEKKSNGLHYSVTLDYMNYNEINWLWEPILERDREDNPEDEAYYEKMYQQLGFTQLFDDHLNTSLYINYAKKMAIIEWYHFEETAQGVKSLIAAAEDHGALGYDIIVDATHSGGGGKSALFLKILADSPFKTTFGNVRVTDTAFAKLKANHHGSQVKDWILDAIEAGHDYTTNEPFKLQLSPRGSDGIMEPAAKRFTGNIVVLFFTLGGSNLDQFASMIADNPQINIHTMGMPTGGYSNTWEWDEDIQLPNGQTIRFEWDIGHTIRPNGEILEGNPAIPKEIIPFTVNNYETYFQNLLQKAIKYLEENSTSSNRYSSVKCNNHNLFQITNPLVGSTATIRFNTINTCEVNIKLYDIYGKKVDTIICEKYLPGLHEFLWKTDYLSNGVYIIMMKQGYQQEAKLVIKC